jgi:hypothetical protein
MKRKKYESYFEGEKKIDIKSVEKIKFFKMVVV